MLDIYGIVRVWDNKKFIPTNLFSFTPKNIYSYSLMLNLPKITKIIENYCIDIDGNLWNLYYPYSSITKMISEYRIVDIRGSQDYESRSYIIIQDENNNLFCCKNNSCCELFELKIPFQVDTLSYNDIKTSSYNPKSARKL